MINAKPRFGYDEETKKLYDYATGHYIDAEGVVDGWDLGLVAELIKQGMSIEAAFKGAPLAGVSVVAAGVPEAATVNGDEDDEVDAE